MSEATSFDWLLVVQLPWYLADVLVALVLAMPFEVVAAILKRRAFKTRVDLRRVVSFFPIL